MASLISASQKASLQSQFFAMHDTFARPIVAFKSATHVTVSTNPNYNPFFNGAPANDVENVYIQSGVFNARIKYNAEQELNLVIGGATDQVNLNKADGVVRIKVDVTGAAYFQDVERAEFDGDLFELFTDKRPHGLFTPDFFTFFLKKLN